MNVHCWGGIGRTGTVVGCFLRGQGFTGDAALQKVQTLYTENMPKAARLAFSPQTREQRDYVRNWLPRGI